MPSRSLFSVSVVVAIASLGWWFQVFPTSPPATGYRVAVRPRVYGGEPCVVAVTPVPNGSRLDETTTITLTNGEGTKVSFTPAPRGGSASLAMPLTSGSQTVTVFSGGKYADPAPFQVAVLPGLRVGRHTGAPPAGNDADNASATGQFFAPCIGTLQGRPYLLFAAGETVGFVLPYAVGRAEIKTNAWEVYDFNGRLVDQGICDVDVSAPHKSDTIVCSHVTLPGAYSLYLYDTTRPARTADFSGVFRFVVLSASRSGLPMIAEGCADKYDNSEVRRFVRMADAVPSTSEGKLNGYATGISGVRAVHRSFVFTPDKDLTLSINCAYAQIEVDGVVLTPYEQISGAEAAYHVPAKVYSAGRPYRVVVKNFLRPNSAGSADGWTLPDILPSAVGAFDSTIKSDAGTPGKVTIKDYPAFFANPGGDHNDVALRMCLGEAGSLTRYPVLNTSQPADYAVAMKLENQGVLGQRDRARERRRIIFNFVDLFTAQQQADSGKTTLQTYSPSGITAFVREFSRSVWTPRTSWWRARTNHRARARNPMGCSWLGFTMASKPLTAGCRSSVPALSPSTGADWRSPGRALPPAATKSMA